MKSPQQEGFVAMTETDVGEDALTLSQLMEVVFRSKGWELILLDDPDHRDVAWELVQQRAAQGEIVFWARTDPIEPRRLLPADALNHFVITDWGRGVLTGPDRRHLYDCRASEVMNSLIAQRKCQEWVRPRMLCGKVVSRSSLMDEARKMWPALTERGFHAIWEVTLDENLKGLGWGKIGRPAK